MANLKTKRSKRGEAPSPGSPNPRLQSQEISDLHLLRWVSGELSDDESEQLVHLSESDPRLAQRMRARSALWQGLEGPSEEGPGSQVRAELLRRFEELHAERSRPPMGSWFRPVAATALVVGVGAGFWVGQRSPETRPIAGWEGPLAPYPTLAESMLGLHDGELEAELETSDSTLLPDSEEG